MLTAIREGAKGWLSGIIIGLIVLTFALFGISSYLEGGREAPVAVVNGDQITSYHYQNQLAQQRQAMESRLDSNFDRSLLNSLGIKQQALDSLINSRLLNQYVADKNFRLSDSQLISRIQTQDAFKTDNKFDPELYQNLLAANRLTPRGFEQIERQNGMVQQFQQAIVESAFLIDNEVNQLLKLQIQSRDVDYAIVSADRYVNQFDVTDEETQAWYDDNIDRYQNVARIKVEYLDLNLEQLATEVKPAADEIVQAYDRIKDRLITPEVRKVSHILFNVDAEADEALKSEQKTLAESVTQRINNGEDFATLATEFSDDTGSATNGGELGIVTKGQMVQPFEDAVFAMQQGDVEGPVETRFGYHIIKLTELTAGKQKTLEEARQEVETNAKRVAAEAIFADMVELFQNLIFEQPDSLNATADETGLPIQVSDWFTASAGQGVAENDKVRRAAFAEDVLVEGLNSEAIELGFERLVAIRKLEYQAASAQPLDEVREKIVNQIKLARSKAKVAQQSAELINGLTDKKSWATKLELNQLTSKKMATQKSEVAAQLTPLAEAVYALSPPVDGQPAYGQLTLANGDAVIYALNAVAEGAVADADPALKQKLEAQLDVRDGAGLYRQVISLLRANAEIVIDNAQL